MEPTQGNPAGPSTLVTISEDPVVRESALTSLDRRVTPTESFYVRNHFDRVPALDPATWRLRVGGLVERPLELTLDDLRSMPSVEPIVTLECAGNSRSYFTPQAEGIAFRHGAVSAARWRGVPLPAVLERAGVGPEAVEVVFHGADKGEEEEDGATFSTDLPYARSLPVAAATDPSMLLAYDMNGQPLPTDHGYPLRLVAPRWYGMASVKWLSRIDVTDKPFEGFFQKRRYVFIQEGEEGLDAREPVTTLKVKSLITTPRHGEVIPPGPFTLRGFAWSGRGEVTTVEVTTDGGESWQPATLLGKADPNCWREWEFPWEAAEPGHFIFMVRATDSAGDAQPPTAPWNFRGYANNGIQTLAVEVPRV